MAYYCYITSVEAPDSSPNHFSVGYELREEVTDRVLFGSTTGITVPTAGTIAQRRQSVIAQLQAFFDDLIARSDSRDQVLDALRDMLVGQRHPPAA